MRDERYLWVVEIWWVNERTGKGQWISTLDAELRRKTSRRLRRESELLGYKSRLVKYVPEPPRKHRKKVVIPPFGAC